MRNTRCLLDKLLIMICLIMFATNMCAQQRYYCEVKGVEKDFSSGLKIIFDFGTDASYTLFGDLSSKLKFVDEKGEDINFNSMVDAANYMALRGWNLQQAYYSVYGGKPIVSWIFYKDADSMEQAKEGIMTKNEYRKLFKSKKNN